MWNRWGVGVKVLGLLPVLDVQAGGASWRYVSEG